MSEEKPLYETTASLRLKMTEAKPNHVPVDHLAAAIQMLATCKYGPTECQAEAHALIAIALALRELIGKLP